MNNPVQRTATLSELVTPDMANHYGNLFGGVLLSLADKAAYVCAARFSRLPCVTASMDQMSFLAPVHIGELLIVTATLLHVGTSSMSIQVIANAENPETGDTRTVSRSLITMVAVQNGKPVGVPPITCEGPAQRRICLQGQRHRILARQYEERLREMEQQIASMTDDEISAELALQQR